MDEDISDIEYQKSNREKYLEPKSGHSYCHICDGDLLNDGQKCRNCGTIHKTSKHNKKRRMKV